MGEVVLLRGLGDENSGVGRACSGAFLLHLKMTDTVSTYTWSVPNSLVYDDEQNKEKGYRLPLPISAH